MNAIPSPIGQIVYEVECVKVRYREWKTVLTNCTIPYFEVCRDCNEDEEEPAEPCFPRLQNCAKVFMPKLKTPITFKMYCQYLEYAKLQADQMACYCDCVDQPNCYTTDEIATIRGYVGEPCTCNETHPRPCNCHNT